MSIVLLELDTQLLPFKKADILEDNLNFTKHFDSDLTISISNYQSVKKIGSIFFVFYGTNILL